MSGLSANFVDLAVIGVMLISALLAFGRGLVREVLSIGAWVAAALAALWGFPYAKDIARKYISITILADVVTATAIFLVTLIICAAISHAIARNVRGSTFGALDRSLAPPFDARRQPVLHSKHQLLHGIGSDHPAHKPANRSRPLVASGADILRSLLPQGALDKGAAAAADARRQLEEQTKQQMLQGIGSDQPAPKPGAAPKQDPGYNANERKDLDRLIQGNQ